MSKLGPAVDRVDESLHSLNLKSANLTAVTRAGSSLQTTVVRVRTAATPLVTDAASRAQVTKALDSLSRLAQDLQKLPQDPLDITNAQASATERDMNAVRGSLQALRVTYPAATLSVPPASAAGRITALANQAAKQRALDAFLGKIDNLLTQSANGRQEVIDTIQGVSDHCSIPPDEASHRLSSVASNRQSLLDQMSALTVPDDPRARRVADLFQSALQHSIEADRHFSDWMDHLFVYYYSFPIGCPGAVPQNNDYDAAVSESRAASAAKQQLVRTTTRSLVKPDLRSNWTEQDI